jgi:TPR repeat protein
LKGSAEEENIAAPNESGGDFCRVFELSMPRTVAVYSFKLAADQGNAIGQSQYGVYLRGDIGIPIDSGVAAQSFKLPANQGNAIGQWQYGVCLFAGIGIPVDSGTAAH